MILLSLIIIPLLAGLLIWLLPKKNNRWVQALALAATFGTLMISGLIFKQNITLSFPGCGLGIEFALRLYNFSAFIVLAIAGFSFLITLFSTAYLADKSTAKLFYVYLLLNQALASGAVLANNLILMLFFWEGLLLTLFGLIYLGGSAAFKTAIKAFVIIGVTDLCLMAGVAMFGLQAGTFSMPQFALPLTGLGSSLAFILMMIGAIGKGGSMPFHSWIPDAALDAPLPFMALIPAAMEKLLGIYLLTRICLDLYKLTPAHWLSPLLMLIGGLTIVLAVMMALIQKDFKKLLSYHAISQVGYMILGVGTAVPAGIIGGLFHMINNALYKSCLFLSGGAVEKQTGTTDLGRLGGLARQMPVTFACFFIAAVSISGVPPFNGFFSKELIYDGALERGWLFYLLAVAGSFFTAASFLKLGHAAFFDKPNKTGVKEAAWPLLVPMIILAAVCLLFGFGNILPIKYLIQPILGEHRLAGHNFYGFPSNLTLVVVTLLVLAGALANHFYGVKKTGRGLGAVDHIHYAPGLKAVYGQAEREAFDPYDLGLVVVGWAAGLLNRLDRAIDWVYEVAVVRLTLAVSRLVSQVHTGNFLVYMIWSLVGAIVVLIIYLKT